MKACRNCIIMTYITVSQQQIMARYRQDALSLTNRSLQWSSHSVTQMVTLQYFIRYCHWSNARQEIRLTFAGDIGIDSQSEFDIVSSWSSLDCNFVTIPAGVKSEISLFIRAFVFRLAASIWDPLWAYNSEAHAYANFCRCEISACEYLREVDLCSYIAYKH